MQPPTIDWQRVGAVAGALAAVVGLLGKLRDLRRKAERERDAIAEEAQHEALRRAARAAGASPFGEPASDEWALAEARARVVMLERDMARAETKLQEAHLQRVRIERENERLMDAMTSLQRDLEMRDVTIRQLRKDVAKQARAIEDLEFRLGDALAVELAESDRITPDPKVAT